MTELHTPEFFLLFFVPLLGLDLPEPPSKSFSIKKEMHRCLIKLSLIEQKLYNELKVHADM